MGVLLADRYGAQHLLQPVLTENPDAFLAIGDDDVVQRIWAKEQGMPSKSTLADILRSQIETHRTEIFYNLDPLRYGSVFLRTLPGSVRYRIGWRAAPSPGANFQGYDLMVCNFPSILDQYRAQGLRAAYFAPAHDPELDAYSANEDRPIDILFVGSYSRHHHRRAQLLESVADLGGQYKVCLHLDVSRATALAESPLGRLLPISRMRRPRSIQAATLPSLYGRDLYRRLSMAKVVVNGAIDMAGTDRGNMRCFEALGCACALLSDSGVYPTGMKNAQTIATYESPADAVAQLIRMLKDPVQTRALAARGHRMIQTTYSKDQQWTSFMMLV